MNKQQVLAKLEKSREQTAQLEMKLEEITKSEREGRWYPDEDDTFYYADEQGSVLATDAEDYDIYHDAGNCFQTRGQAEHASVLARSLFIQLQFAYAAGGTGRARSGSYMLGREGPLPVRTIPYATVVYFPDRDSAQACWEFLTDRGWLYPKYPTNDFPKGKK